MFLKSFPLAKDFLLLNRWKKLIFENGTRNILFLRIFFVKVYKDLYLEIRTSIYQLKANLDFENIAHTKI